MGGQAFSQTESLEVLVEKSQLAMKENQWEQALGYHTQALTRFGTNEALRIYGAQFGAIHYRRGLCEMKLKRWQDALRSFEICYRDFPNEGTERGNPFQKMALLKWGEAAMGAGEWEMAISRFAKFTGERDKVRDPFPQGAFYINLAVCHYRLGRIPAGNENLEIAIHNKGNFPTSDPGILAGFQALGEAAIARGDEQALLDFIQKNRGGLVFDPVEMMRYSGVFLKLAGDAFAAGMQRAAIAVYQFLPSVEPGPQEIVRLAAIALIHEQNGNVRGAFAAYRQIERYYSEAPDRERHLYQLIRTAGLIGEEELARKYAGRLFRDFPQSPHLAEIRTSGIDIPENDPAEPPLETSSAVAAAKPLPTSSAFTAAMDFYQGRKYQEAKAAFEQLPQVPTADPETVALAGFYEMECLRKLGDLDGLAKALGGASRNASLGANRLLQLEINPLWELLRTKQWERLDQSAQLISRQRLSGDQRAQVAYCRGQALENLARPLEALNCYNIAMTADAGASEEVARPAALGVLRIHLADPEVQAVLTASNPSGANAESHGNLWRREAAGVAKLFELTLGTGTPLPAEFAVFLRAKAE